MLFRKPLPVPGARCAAIAATYRMDEEACVAACLASASGMRRNASARHIKTTPSSLDTLLERVQPTEIYNLAAQSHVGVSFTVPDYSSQVNALGTLRLLSSIREVGLESRFYQASSSELYGGIPGTEPQSEGTAFTPRSPYAAAKLFSYWVT